MIGNRRENFHGADGFLPGHAFVYAPGMREKSHQLENSSAQAPVQVGAMLAIAVLAKFFVDTATQLFNPYLLVYASGAGLTGLTMGRLVSVRNLSGLVAPIIGGLADRYGYRRIMQVNLLLIASGILLFAAAGNLFWLVLAMLLWGAGQGGFAPNAHSYLSALLPYHKRSRYLGILEYSWALAGIFGLSVIGVLIEKSGWKLPLYILAGGMLISAVCMFVLPSRHGREEEDAVQTAKAGENSVQPVKPSRMERIRAFLHLGPNRRSAWAAIGVNFFNFFALFHLMISHGIFLETEYSLTPSRLGQVALMLGIADWAGSILVSTAGDRIGKRRSLMYGTMGMSLGFILLPILNISLIPALAGLIIPRFFFEFTTVSNFPLLSEQYPEGRGRVLALGVAGGLLGSTIAASTGPAMYLRFGLWGIGPVSAAANLCALALLIWLVKDGE